MEFTFLRALCELCVLISHSELLEKHDPGPRNRKLHITKSNYFDTINVYISRF